MSKAMRSQRPNRDAEADKVIAQLREFNRVGLMAIATLTAATEDLQRRLTALEDFQRKLTKPGEPGGAN